MYKTYPESKTQLNSAKSLNSLSPNMYISFDILDRILLLLIFHQYYLEFHFFPIFIFLLIYKL